MPEPSVQLKPAPEAPSGENRFTPRVRIAVISGITALAALLRLLYLGKKSFWLDEIVSVSIARLDPAGFRNVVLSWELNEGLYYTLLRGWMHLGQSEFVVRLLSALPAVAAIPFVYLLGRRLFSETVGMIAALLLAVNAFDVRYAQEARGYSLFAFLVVLACWFFVRCVDAPQKKGNWVGLVIALALGMYAHFFAAFMLPVFWLAAALRKGVFPWRRFLISSGIIVVLAIPAVLFVATKNRGQVSWVQPTTWRDLYDLAILLSGRSGLALLLLCATGLALALVRMLRLPAREGTQVLWGGALVWMWLVVPVAMTVAISMLKPMFVARYLIFCLPAFVLLVAAGLDVIRPRWLMAGVLLAISWLSLRGVTDYYRTGFDPPEQDWRGAVHYMLSQTQPGDAVLFYHPLARLAYEYYRPRWPQYPAPMVVFPPRADARLLKGTQPDFALLPHLPEQYRRLWLVQNWGPDPLTDRMHSIFAARYSRAEERDFSIIRIVLYQSALPK
ncbi:MAG TPA: glycosyltransferase family 39 protein [Terriglobales bacterium]|nr:glycosyltransferase family 39 protein [Terriglobales bacterium]